VQRVDGESGGAQDADPLAVAWVELHPAAGGWQVVCLALRSLQAFQRRPVVPGRHKVTRMLAVWEIRPPPGRNSRAASGTQRAGSHHKLAPHSEMARSKLSPGRGMFPASASMSGNEIPKWFWHRRDVASWAGVTSTSTGRAPCLASHAEKYAVPHPSSTTSKPETSPRMPS
jgi:hypothetical protein